MFTVLLHNSSRGLKRTLICTTTAGGNREAQTLFPEFPRGSLNHFWKCAKGEVSHVGRMRTACLTLFAGAGTTCNCGTTSAHQVCNKSTWGWWTEDHKRKVFVCKHCHKAGIIQPKAMGFASKSPRIHFPKNLLFSESPFERRKIAGARLPPSPSAIGCSCGDRMVKSKCWFFAAHTWVMMQVSLCVHWFT